jgi:signal transduction histidine kinase
MTRFNAPFATHGASIRAVLVIGFALVLGLWVLWGAQLVRGLEEIQHSAAAVHASYVRGEQTLSRVRTNVLLGSIYLRDALIETGSAQHGESRPELARLRSEVEELLRRYIGEVASEPEREHWTRLQAELTDYWTSREIALAERNIRGPVEAAALLRRRVVPSRDTVLGIVDQISALQEAANARHQLEARARYERIRTRLFSIGSATLLFAAVVAVLASRHAYRLERRVDQQRRNERHTREELERLSARLVNVQEEERRTLARELHDEVGQALTALKMDVGVALRSDLQDRARGALEEAKEIAETTLRCVRDLSQLLHPSMLDDFGLPATLSTYLRSFSQRTGIRAQLAETLEDRLSPEIELCVYRIVQEALSNVAQHSGATACTVSLSGGEGILRLAIEDNGHGLPGPSPAPVRQGLGILGMRERAQAFGGTFALGSNVGGGASIVVTLPFHIVSAPALEPRRQAV